MPRLFVAIDLPPDVRENIADLCYGVSGAKWVPQAQIHLTLRFIGDVDDRNYHDIVDALSRVEAMAFSFVLKGTGYFPPRRDPRVVWIGIENADDIFALQKKIDNVLVETGVQPEERKFHPHITVARLRERASAAQAAAFVAANTMFKSRPIDVSEFILYSSVLTRDDPVHTAEALFELRG